MVANLLDEQAHFKRCVEPGWRIEGQAEQAINVTRLSVNRVRAYPKRCQFRIVAWEVPEQIPGFNEGRDLIFDDEISDASLAMNPWTS